MPLLIILIDAHAMNTSVERVSRSIVIIDKYGTTKGLVKLELTEFGGKYAQINCLIV